ncbi:ISL3 family transposase [Acidithiobacillus ferrooxidans]|jgi:transposase|uniref:ISL3 family transposase n=1 Tax=Acidithiobacillus ferrooxidans TaxID=920 RepID=UPI00214730E8|nr:ISL3 family transposase [Acidithiobacillus ferrooxidans]MCR1345509.1 ISL3 family transposase [Acidithiobacillus ferrooxidans]MCR1355795.1 ISL3 family transposase [Acidithiobacillus ferrooxidans]
MPPDILNLPQYQVLRAEDIDHDYHIYAETTVHPETCIHCGSTAIVGFGRREQLIRDLPIHGKRVGVYVDTRRYRCKSCGKTFYEPLPSIDEKRRMTRRLAAWLGEQSLRQTFARLAEEAGVSNMTVKAVFDDHAARMARNLRIETPEMLGIDEIHLIRKPRAILTNARSCLVVEILDNRDKKTVIRYLSGLPDRERVRCVAMDMWRPYHDAAREVLPWAAVVVDKFHVLRMANQALDDVRKSVGAGLPIGRRRTLMRDRKALLMRPEDLGMEGTLRLSGWLRNVPLLDAAYRAKEGLYGVYEERSKTKALRRYQEWEDALEGGIRDAFQPVVTAFRDWRTEIFAHFDWRVTNACAESANNLIRVANRMGRGYSFDVLRARILLANHAGHRKRKIFQRRKPVATDAEAMAYFSLPSTREESDEISEGVDTSTLLRLVEKGEF